MNYVEFHLRNTAVLVGKLLLKCILISIMKIIVETKRNKYNYEKKQIQILLKQIQLLKQKDTYLQF